MSSFVCQVLSASGSLTRKEDLSAIIARLSSTAETLKFKLRQNVEYEYEDIGSCLSETIQLGKQLEECSNEVDSLRSEVFTSSHGVLDNGIHQFEDILRELDNLSSTIQTANAIRQYQKNLESLKESLAESNWEETSDKLEALHQQILSMTSLTDEDHIKAINVLKSECVYISDELHSVLLEEWKTNLIIDSESLYLNGKKLYSSFKGLHKAQLLSSSLSVFSSKFLDIIIIPLLEGKSLSVYSNKITVTNSSKNGYLDIFSHLTNAFLFLLTQVGTFTLEDSTSFLSMMGTFIESKLINLIIDKLLRASLPTSSSKLSEYDVIIEATQELQILFDSLQFSKSSELTNYVANIDVLFIDKLISDFLGEARRIILSDIHDTIAYEPKPQLSPEDTRKIIRELSNLSFTNEINDLGIQESDLPIPTELKDRGSPFTFPKCVISRSMIQLNDLIRQMLTEASFSSASSRLYVGARYVFDLYLCLLPQIKGESESIPLMYNNCFFLSHQCLILGFDFQSSNIQSPSLFTFVDYVVPLREAGEKILSKRLNIQRNLNSELIQSASFQKVSNTISLSGEKYLQQILHQLTTLKNVWKPILPSGIFIRSMNSLVYYTLEDIMNDILKQDDIAADSASQMVTFFTMFVERVPFILENKKAVTAIKNWRRFEELITVLNSSLREIEDRWQSGKGPLAQEFKAEEIKKMIRALFQNTEKRAMVLSKIQFEAS